ncbi:hypothetical protein [Clostridium transplantifaecale]|uniref:hypothetical protein n=1 Tax=Clostridium transplantifaecale TaxID=2479838 RepID=UPI000F642605|nr:hypothetical protein [Clostridium transplantifaecale]
MEKIKKTLKAEAGYGQTSFSDKILLDSQLQLLYNLHKCAVIKCGYEGLDYEYYKSGKSRF